MTAFLLITGFMLWFIDALVFDRLIEYQYNFYRDSWVSDGKPRGMFFNPPKSSYFSFTIMGVIYGWSAETPYWIEEDSKASQLYKRVKFWNLITKWFYISFFPLLILGLVI